MATCVVNKRDEHYDIYVGRMRNTQFHYGNPFSHLSSGLHAVRVATRNESIKRFRSWLRGTTDRDLEQPRRHWILQTLPTLHNKTLGCFCKPMDCHGDVLAEFADKVVQGIEI